MGAEAIIIGEILVGVLQVFAEKYKAAGLTAEETKRQINESVERILKTMPEDLPVID